MPFCRAPGSTCSLQWVWSSCDGILWDGGYLLPLPAMPLLPGMPGATIPLARVLDSYPSYLGLETWAWVLPFTCWNTCCHYRLRPLPAAATCLPAWNACKHWVPVHLEFLPDALAPLWTACHRLFACCPAAPSLPPATQEGHLRLPRLLLRFSPGFCRACLGGIPPFSKTPAYTTLCSGGLEGLTCSPGYRLG